MVYVHGMYVHFASLSFLSALFTYPDASCLPPFLRLCTVYNYFLSLRLILLLS